MNAGIRLVVVVCLIAGIPGCVDRKNCPSCMLSDPLTVGCPYAGSQITSSLHAKVAPNVLVLSGGASHGAWGAGVITGWPTSGVVEPRPAAFDIVTGISTGALQAPYAFLGGSLYDDKLEMFYTTTTNSEIYSIKPDFLISNGLQDRTPLRQILEENVTAPEVRKVGQIADRELYVGTINLDTSQFCPWNLSTIARNAAAELDDSPAEACWVDLFRDAMFASAGAPVITPPVEIDVNACKPGDPLPQKMLFADGGVRERVFVSDVVKQLPSTSKPIIYVIMNGQLSTRPTCVSNQLLPITLRTYEIMDHVALFGSLYALMHQHQNWSLRLSRIPDTQCVSLPNFEFDPIRMKAMFDGGSAWVQQPSPWETTVPAAAVANWPSGVAKPPEECAKLSDLQQQLLAPCPM